jgi:hypothetical protein
MPNCFWVCDVKCVILNESMVLCFTCTNVWWTRSSWVYPLGYLSKLYWNHLNWNWNWNSKNGLMVFESPWVHIFHHLVCSFSMLVVIPMIQEFLELKLRLTIRSYIKVMHSKKICNVCGRHLIFINFPPRNWKRYYAYYSRMGKKLCLFKLGVKTSHYYKMWVKFISPYSLDQWIHCSFTSLNSLQPVNSLKI